MCGNVDGGRIVRVVKFNGKEGISSLMDESQTAILWFDRMRHLFRGAIGLLHPKHENGANATQRGSGSR